MQLRTAEDLAIFSERLFRVPSNERSLSSPIIRNWVEHAEKNLRSVAGATYHRLPSRAQDDLKRTLATFLAQLLLTNPDAECLRKVSRSWVQAQMEFLQRLETDREEIERVFFDGLRCGRVTAIASDLSDRHNQGRSVVCVTFESGIKLIYKPRNIGVEGWYFSLLGWLNDLDAPSPFKVLETVQKNEYGWIQFADHRYCRSKHERRSYYRNAGALLCVLYILRARDCHFQNLIACGVHPVLIDAETLFQPQLATDSDINSVAQIGLIPSWKFGPKGEPYDTSALGCVSPQTTHFQVWSWTVHGARLTPAVLVPQENVPFLHSDRESPCSYVEDIAFGFGETYRFLVEHRMLLTKRIKSAAGEQIRYVIRDTVEYYRALNGMLLPGAMRGVTLPSLVDHCGIFEPLRQEEVRSLEEFDVPRFTLSTSSYSLYGIEKCFRLCGHEVVLESIERLCEDDLKRQVKLIRLSWSLFRIASLLSKKTLYESDPA